MKKCFKSQQIVSKMRYIANFIESSFPKSEFAVQSLEEQSVQGKVLERLQEIQGFLGMNERRKACQIKGND